MRAQFTADVPHLEAAAEVRRWLVATVAEWRVPDEVASTATLIASELATNAVKHAGTGFTVSLSYEPAIGTLRVEVFDGDTRLPIAVAADEQATGGRGLMIVNTIAGRWGAQTAEADGVAGKIVWAEVEPGESLD